MNKESTNTGLTKAMWLTGVILVCLIQLLLAPSAYAQEGLSEEKPDEISHIEAPSGDASAQESEDTASNASSAPVADESGSSAQRSSERTRSDLIEEIVVTAQKREENLMAVPISIQAFSPEALAARGIDNQSGLTQAVPSLNIGTQAGYNTVYLRGIGTEAFLTADPSIASYIDGVYYPFSPSFIQEFGAIERVEVLKGPQGTLFGRNASGGAISVITKSPDFSEDHMSAEVVIGNFNSMTERMYLNVPIADSLAFNVSAFYKKSDPYLEGSSGGKPLHDETNKGVRLKGRWAPTENLDITLSFTNTLGMDNGALGVLLYPSPLAKILTEPAGHEYETHVNERLYRRVSARVTGAEVLYKMPWLDVKLLASEQYDQQPYNFDFDGSVRPYVWFDVPGHTADIQQADLQFLSNESTPGADWLKITGGFFIFKNEQGFNPLQLTVANLNPASPGGNPLTNLGIQLPSQLNDALSGFFGPDGDLAALFGGVLPDSPLYRLGNTGLVKTDSKSAYLQFTADLTEWMSLTLGGRYQNERRGVSETFTTFQALDVGEPITVLPWTSAREDGRPAPLFKTTKGFNPKVAVDFHPFDDDTLLFASYQKAVKAHSYNALAIYLPPEVVKAETTQAYEAGIKTRLFDGAATFNASVFLYKIHNLQTMLVSLITGGAVSLENAPEARSRGIDFDLTAEVLPSLIDGLGVSLNAAYIDAEFTDYPNASGYDPNTEVFRTGNDSTGNRLPRTAKYSGSLAVTKKWVLDDSEFELGSDYYYNSGFFYTSINDPLYEQLSYGLVGAFASYRYEPWGVKATLFGKNLTDKYYTSGVVPTDFGGLYSPAPPRLYGLRVSINF